MYKKFFGQLYKSCPFYFLYIYDGIDTILVKGEYKMGKRIDLINQKFGMQTVLEETSERDASGGIMWKCKCECGTIKNVSGQSLRKGKSTCCGCIKQNQSNEMIGKKFGMLTVIEKIPKRTINGSIQQKCKCDCGNECIRSTTGLHRIDRIQNCGCYNKTINLDLSIIGKKFNKLTVLEYVGNRMYKCKCECGDEKIIRRDSLITGNTSSCGCINYSIGEKNIENILKLNNIIFKSQYTEPELKLKKFDFAIIKDNKISQLIEFDGQQHYNDINGIWNSSESLENIQQRDQEKNQQAKEHNIPLVRIPYQERDNITLEMIIGDKYLVK